MVSKERAGIAGLNINSKRPPSSTKSTSHAPAPFNEMNAADVLKAAQTALQYADQGMHFFNGLFGSKSKATESSETLVQTPGEPADNLQATESSETLVETPPSSGEDAKVAEHAETAEHAEVPEKAKPKPERFFAGTKLEGTVGFLRKINPVLSHAMTKAEEARANGDNVAVGALKGYGGGIYGAVKGVASGVSTAMTTGLAVETLNPVGLAALVGTSAYAGASKNSEDAPEFVKKVSGKLV